MDVAEESDNTNCEVFVEPDGQVTQVSAPGGHIGFKSLLLLTEENVGGQAPIASPCRTHGTSNLTIRLTCKGYTPLLVGSDQKLRRRCFVQALLPWRGAESGSGAHPLVQLCLHDPAVMRLA